MPEQATRLADASPEQRTEAITRAAEALREGSLVVLPTETVYGLFASGASPRALAALAAATGAEPAAPLVWHAGDADAVRSLLDRPTPVARRLTAKFMPGPVRFEVEQPPEHLAALRRALGVPAGVIESAGVVRVRVPDHPVCAEVLSEAKVAAVAVGIGSAVWASREAGRTVGTIPEEAGAPLPGAVLDDGPTPLGTPSTVVRLNLDGSFEVLPGGAIDEAAVLAALERVVLFVCTGNTCRSAMAEAIAAAALRTRPYDGITTRVASAGVAAGAGIGAAPDAVEVLRAKGLDLTPHRSRPLTRQMLREAEIVFTMTPSHAEAVMTMAPDLAYKVFPLDPRGVIEDPVGQGRAVYERTAERLAALIDERLKELDA